MQSWLWLPLALLSAFFAALVAIFGKIGLEKVDSTLATTVRSAVMFLFLLLAALALGKMDGIGSIKGKAATFIVLSGLAGALSWLFYFWALKAGKATRVASFDRLSVVFVFVLATIFLGEKIGLKSGIGVVFMTAGAILIAVAK